jgi:hypothetical protein
MGSGIEIKCSFCYEDDRKGTHYELLLGCGMMCFCKEQLREYYDIENNRTIKLFGFNESPIEDESINKTILSNLKKGFSFTEHLGYIPYYCETCETIISLFYFQMELNGNYYVPKYNCHRCKNDLEPLNIIWENYENNSEEDPIKNIGIKYKMYMNKDNTIKIVSENEEKKLICRYCNNDKFIYADDFIDWD